MALNEIQMNQFREGLTGTGGRVDELTLPVDISHQSRSQQADANEKDLDLELNLQKENVGAQDASGSSREADELVHDPVSESREEIQDDGVGSRTHQPVGDPEHTDHTVTMEKSAERICRTCGPDEPEVPAEPDNLLVKLGCRCRGSLSRMHRKCILEWYGPRICQESNYKCELCNALLHGRIEHIVFRALIGQDSGTDILIKALRIMAAHRQRNAVATEAPALPAHDDGNAPHPDFHQINIVEITQGQTQQEQYHGSTRSGFPMCVVFFVILVLVGLGVWRGW